MSQNNAVSLMGAHSVGKLQSANSGYKGSWIPENKDGLSTQYFRNIANNEWEQTVSWESFYTGCYIVDRHIFQGEGMIPKKVVLCFKKF